MDTRKEPAPDTALKALKLIAEKTQGKKGAVGEVACPHCGGVVKYQTAPSNGHIHARCVNRCFAFMQ